MNRKEVLIAALYAASAEIVKYDPRTVATKVKSTAGDLLTAADKGSEAAILAVIRHAFPEETIVSEELEAGHGLLKPERLHDFTGWVIDPIDGTNNFKRGFAYSGISIGYIEQGEIVLGGVCDPYRQALYLAARGQGATCNDQKMTVSAKATFDAATRVCTSNSYEGGTQENLNRYAKLGHVWVDVLGSAVLIMMDVAAGRLDLYHHNGLKPWDNAAAFLIAAEAGAKIVGLQGQPVTWLTAEVVVGNPRLVDEFVRRTT